MKPLLTQQERSQLLETAMQSLLGNSNFDVFMDAVAEARHAASMDMVNEAVLKDSRLSLVAAGEVRALDGIIAIWQNHVDQRLAQAESD